MARIVEHRGWIAVAAVVVLAVGVGVAFERLTSSQPFTVEDAVDDYRLGLEDDALPAPGPAPDSAEREAEEDQEAADERDEPEDPSQGEAAQDGQTEEQRNAERERREQEAEQERQAEAERREREAEQERREREPEQERQAEAEGPSLVRPEPGVYRYRTDGEGRVDVPGARHRYPEETTITVRHDECGYTTRWRPVEERWEENQLCLTGDRLGVAAMTNYREFMGESVRSEMTCDEGFLLVPPDAQTGATWTGHCEDEANDMRTTVHGEVVRRGMVEAAGEQVEALHLRFESQVRGENEGYNRAERIVAAGTGLLLHASSETEMTSDGPMGRTYTYRESYTVDLIDLQPSQ